MNEFTLIGIGIYLIFGFIFAEVVNKSMKKKLHDYESTLSLLLEEKRECETLEEKQAYTKLILELDENYKEFLDSNIRGNLTKNVEKKLYLIFLVAWLPATIFGIIKVVSEKK